MDKRWWSDYGRRSAGLDRTKKEEDECYYKDGESVAKRVGEQAWLTEWELVQQV